MVAQPYPLPTTHAPQEGFVLIVGLVILGLLTMLALSSMRDTTMQEKMAGASRDSGLAFQAAESALRDAEKSLMDDADAECKFDTANDAHFSRDDTTYPEGPRHNNLFDASYWAGIAPPCEPTALSGEPIANYIIRETGAVSGTGSRGTDEEEAAVTDVGTLDYDKTRTEDPQPIYEIIARGAGAGGAGQSVLRVYFRK